MNRSESHDVNKRLNKTWKAMRLMHAIASMTDEEFDQKLFLLKQNSRLAQFKQSNKK